MKSREQIVDRQYAISEEIKVLESECTELQKEAFLLCDDKQRFEEKMETLGIGKKKEEALVGRRSFN